MAIWACTSYVGVIEGVGEQGLGSGFGELRFG